VGDDDDGGDDGQDKGSSTKIRGLFISNESPEISPLLYNSF